MARKSISTFVVALALLVGVLLSPASTNATAQVQSRPSLSITMDAAGPLPVILRHTSGGSTLEAQSESLSFAYADNQFKVTMKVGNSNADRPCRWTGLPRG